MRILRSVGFGFLVLFICETTHAFVSKTANQFSCAKELSDATSEEHSFSGQQAAGGQGQSQPTPTSSKADDTEKAAESYNIGIGDDLQISVWREPELSLPVQVRPDGMITLPLINDLPVVGLTTHQLQALLTEKLKPFVNEPQVTVIVRNIKSRKVYLMGQVARPGPYPLNDKKTVLQLITEAGGPGQFAKTGSIYILRTIDGKQSRLKFNYKKALAGKPDAGDIELLPGDMVVVP